MARSVQSAGDYYGHRHEDLRLRSEYRQHLREANNNPEDIESLLDHTPGFSRTTY